MPDYSVSLPNVNYPYVEIVFGAESNGSSFSLTSSLSDNGGRPKYFINLSHKRIVNKANNVTLEVKFAPGASNDFSDANYLEKEIVSRMGLATIKYGYVGNWTTYWTVLTNYTVGFDSGVLSYTFTGISEAVEYNYNLFNFKYENKGFTANDFLNKLNDAVKQATENRYEIDINRSTKKFELASSDGVNITDYSVLGTVKTIVSQLKILNNDDNDKFLIVVVDDAVYEQSTAKKIIIKECSCRNNQAPAVRYSFAWNNPTGGVISWSTDYHGDIALWRVRGANSGNTNFNKDDLVSRLIDPISGKVKSITSTYLSDNHFMLANLSQVEDIQVYDDNYWSQMANYPNSGELTVLGNPDQSLILGDYVEVNVILGNSLHHTSGVYMIREITDNVGSNGFTTTYSLLKYEQAGALSSKNADSLSSPIRSYTSGNLIRIENSGPSFIN